MKLKPDKSVCHYTALQVVNTSLLSMSVMHQINRIFYSVNPRNIPDSLVLMI
ncbi:hypothetical protein D1AOALGA4SA_1502 [Olavius algarvensis Delta 1 endosymbiont]|nr:hypothetical protein D1AOALGA4SA_1502 [Olavius algarvensis Delta 1 endosymbiont]